MNDRSKRLMLSIFEYMKEMKEKWGEKTGQNLSDYLDSLNQTWNLVTEMNEVYFDIRDLRLTILSIELLLKTYSGKYGGLNKADEIILDDLKISSPWYTE